MINDGGFKGGGGYAYVRERLGIVSVKDFGAAGNGVTDDTAAIQAATDAAYSAGGGTVYFPEGSYLISGEIVPSSSTARVAFVGAGWGIPADTPTGSWIAPTSGTILIQSAPDLNIFHVSQQIAGIDIRDMALQFTASSTGHGIFFDPKTMLEGTSPDFEQLPIVMGYALSNLLVYGYDDAHYAYYLGNALNGHLTFLNGAGHGGFLKFYSYHPSGATATYNFGNVVMDGYWEHSGIGTYDPQVAVVSFENDNNTTTGTPTLNYIHHRGVLDILLNENLSVNLIESVSTGTELGIGDALCIDTLVQNDLGGYLAPIDNGNSGLYVGISDEKMGQLSFPNQPNFRYQYSPAVNLAALSGSTPGTIQTQTINTVSAGLYRVTVNLNVNTYTSGTVEAQVDYTSGWDSAANTLTLCSLSANGETSGSQLIYASGKSSFTVGVAGTFDADYHAWGVVEQLMN